MFPSLIFREYWSSICLVFFNVFFEKRLDLILLQKSCSKSSPRILESSWEENGNPFRVRLEERKKSWPKFGDFGCETVYIIHIWYHSRSYLYNGRNVHPNLKPQDSLRFLKIFFEISVQRVLGLVSMISNLVTRSWYSLDVIFFFYNVIDITQEEFIVPGLKKPSDYWSGLRKIQICWLDLDTRWIWLPSSDQSLYYFSIDFFFVFSFFIPG